MMPDEMRRQIVIGCEGNALGNAGNQGVDFAADLARCQVDGNMNALVRMIGREEAAKYALALGDRVAGGLREPTALPWLVPPKPEPLPDFPPADWSPEPAPAPPPKRMNFWTIFIIGWVFGFLTGATR